MEPHKSANSPGDPLRGSVRVVRRRVENVPAPHPPDSPDGSDSGVLYGEDAVASLVVHIAHILRQLPEDAGTPVPESIPDIVGEETKVP